MGRERVQHQKFYASSRARWTRDSFEAFPWFTFTVGPRATLDEDPRSRVQWNRAVLLGESHKLNPWPLMRVKTKKWQIKAKPAWHHFWGKINSFRLKKRAKKESLWFEPRCKLHSKAVSNSRIQFASKEFKLVPRNLEPGPPSKVGLSFASAWLMLGWSMCWNLLGY